jgi:hypothetical protein
LYFDEIIDLYFKLFSWEKHLIERGLMVKITQDSFITATTAAFESYKNNNNFLVLESPNYVCTVSLDDTIFNAELCETDCCGDVCLKILMSVKGNNGQKLRVGDIVTIVTEKSHSELTNIVSDMLRGLVSRMETEIAKTAK